MAAILNDIEHINPSQPISNKRIRDIQLLDEKTLLYKLYDSYLHIETIIICDIDTGEKINTIELGCITYGNIICVDCKYIIWSRLFTQLHKRYQTTYLNIYDIKQKKNKEIEDYFQYCDIDLYNIDNNHFMYRCNNSEIYVYDITNDKCIQYYCDHQLKRFRRCILNIKIFSDKKHCIFNDKSFINIWDMFNGNITKKFELYNIDSITLCLDEKHIIIQLPYIKNTETIENTENIEETEDIEDNIQYEIKYINIEDENLISRLIDYDNIGNNLYGSFTMCLNNKYFICIGEDKYNCISNPIMHIISIETNERFIYNMEDFDFDLGIPIFKKYCNINIQKVIPHPNGNSLLIHFKLSDDNKNKLETIIHMELPSKAQGIYNL